MVRRRCGASDSKVSASRFCLVAVKGSAEKSLQFWCQEFAMKRLLAACALVFWTAASMADNDAATPPASATMPGLQLATVPAPSVPTARPRGVAPGLTAAQDSTPSTTQSSAPAVNGETAPAAAPATFHAEEKWGLAGYNNNE